MRLIILFGFLTTLSVASSREYHPHRRENAPLRRYKDTKNKRGIGDYPFGLPSFGGSPLSGFQSPPPPPAASPFGGGFPGFGGFGGGSPLGLSPNPFGISSASPSAFSALGSSGLGSLGSYSGFSQPLSLGQGSGYSLSGSGINLASLLGGQGNTQTSYSSPSIGLFSPADKNGPVTFTSQSASSGQSQQQYTPMYATATQLGSNSYSSPVASSSSQGPSIQAYSQPSTMSLGSLLSGNGLTYNSPSSSSSSGDSVAHAVSSNYVIAAAPQQQSGSASSYSFPLPAVASPSSPQYTITLPASYGATSAQSAGSSPSGATYQLSISPSGYSASPLSSNSNHYTKYTPLSSDGSTYINKAPSNTYNAAVKLASYASPGMIYDSSSKPTAQQSTSAGTNYASSSASNQALTSYGTPIMMFAIPSTNYGTPSQHGSSSQYSSSSNANANPSLGYAAASSYSNPIPTSSSSSYQTGNLQKAQISNYGSSAGSYSAPSTNYGSSASGSSAESNSISNYKNQSPSSTSTLSNSIENYSSAGQSNSYESGTDSSGSYSNHAPRYIKYPNGRPSPYLENDDESMGSSYDTISYSVSSEKY